jgi:hypothetical protein
MINKLFKNKGHKVRLGHGTVKLGTSKLKDGGQLILTQIEKSNSGGLPGLTVKDADRVVLQFSSVNSINLMISQLETLKLILLEQR